MSPFQWLAWLYWNPPREVFRVPYLDQPVVWYGVLFVTGFILGYFILVPIFSRYLRNHTSIPENEIRGTTFQLLDRMVWFIVIGALVGARLGAVFFYDWDYFKQHPEMIYQVWRGGLASHGGVAAVALALYLYLLTVKKWVPNLSYLRLLDFVAIPSALAAAFIRLGNFMNQEIVGTPTTLPWAVVFGHAADGSLPIPRHPVQLYEALAYFVTFLILYRVWQTKGEQLKSGFIFGLLFIFIFGSRIILEFWKAHQDSIWDGPFLQIGQLLSVPFVLLGLFLVFRGNCSSSQSKTAS